MDAEGRSATGGGVPAANIPHPTLSVPPLLAPSLVQRAKSKLVLEAVVVRKMRHKPSDDRLNAAELQASWLKVVD